MILADTNILIDYYRSRESDLVQKVDSLDIAICGPVKTELLHGARSNEETDKIIASFKVFENVPLDEYDWEFTGIMLQTIRKCGYVIPVTDVMIAYTGIKHDIPIWTKDQHFKFIQTIYPELKLYEAD